MRIIERKQAEETRENILIGKLMIKVVDGGIAVFGNTGSQGRQGLIDYLWDQADERERKALAEWATKALRAPVLTEKP